MPNPFRLAVPKFQWRPFCAISSAAEAAFASESCLFSLDTLEVSHSPDRTCLGLTEREEPWVWRWAIVSPAGLVIEEGRAGTRRKARKMAEVALRIFETKGLPAEREDGNHGSSMLMAN